MQKFLESCKRHGVSNLVQRKANLQAAFARFAEENYLFLTTGYDYIYAPADRKWDGILDLFINTRGTYHINMNDSAVNEIYRLTRAGDGSVKLENGAAHKIENFVHTGGVKAGGVANYNLCTKSLDIAVKGAGSQLDHGITQALSQGKGKGLDGSMKQRMAEAHQVLRPYWSEKEIITFGLVVRQ